MEFLISQKEQLQKIIDHYGHRSQKEMLFEEFAELQKEVDYYKHEYYSECDLREKLEKALDKACRMLETHVWDLTKEEWKEWCLEDVD